MRWQNGGKEEEEEEEEEEAGAGAGSGFVTVRSGGASRCLTNAPASSACCPP
jgi:hypothetical protein